MTIGECILRIEEGLVLSWSREEGQETFEVSSRLERARLVGFCARLTGERDVAEDLAQETLVVAWQHENELRDPARRAQWLTGIARNLSFQWLRKRHRLPEWPSRSDRGGDSDPPALEEEVADGFDLEVELERSELADLLDRAMALLPPLTRNVLVERYFQDSPQAEIARRLGLTEGAVEARLQRGKLALRRLLANDLRPEAESYGLVAAQGDSWQGTRLWCPLCCQNRVEWRVTDHSSRIEFRCPACSADCGVPVICGEVKGLFSGIRGYRRGLARLMGWAYRYYQRAADRGLVECGNCGLPTRVHLGVLDEHVPVPLKGTRLLSAQCPACNRSVNSQLAAIGLCLAEGQRFWREHPGLRLLPESVVEANGASALVTGFQDRTSNARLEVVYSLDTLRVMQIQES
jgi:RNA polymerase sigma-70 factor (ECF subfamily)